MTNNELLVFLTDLVMKLNFLLDSKFFTIFDR